MPNKSHVLSKSLHPESPTNTNKQESDPNKCLKNKRKAIVFSVFTDQWASMVLSVPLNLTFTTEQTKSMKPSFSTPDCRRSPSTMLWLQRSSSFSSGLVPTQLTLPTQAQAVNSQDRHEWRLPRTLPFILATILSPFSCRLQIPLQAIPTTAGNHQAQWQKATVWLSPPALSLSRYVRFHSN